jgi:hypothetical protein
LRHHSNQVLSFQLGMPARLLGTRKVRHACLRGRMPLSWPANILRWLCVLRWQGMSTGLLQKTFTEFAICVLCNTNFSETEKTDSVTPKDKRLAGFLQRAACPSRGASEAAGPTNREVRPALLFTMRIEISTRHGTLGQMRGKFKRPVAHFPRFAGLARNPQLLPNDSPDVRESRIVPLHVGVEGQNARDHVGRSLVFVVGLCKRAGVFQGREHSGGLSAVACWVQSPGRDGAS